MDVLTSGASSNSFRRWVRHTSVLTCLLGVALQASRAAEQPAPLEYQLKAAFLLKFTNFVDWPADGFADAAAPIAICVAGDAPIGEVLEQMVQGESVNGRKVVMLRAPPDSSKSCQVLFIGKAEKDVPKLLSSLGRNVLTVGETDSFLPDGGMINFVLDNRRVRFDINQKAVSGSALKLSSKLFSVARKVEK
jgi:hypothetical protein